MPTLKEYLEKLPPDLQQEVKDFVEFLMEKRNKKSKRKLRLNWAGALKDYRDKYTSLELQKKVLEWRSD
jgi:galactose-1-phosphate uridylyltransferase